MNPNSGRSRGFFWLGIAAFLLWVYVAAYLPAAPRSSSLVALDARDLAAVCAPPGCSASDFMDRAKAMGVGALAVRSDNVMELSERGQVLAFTRAELEKWRGIGLIVPGAALKTNVLWIKDPKLFVRVSGVLRAHGLVLGTGTASGYGLVELSRDPDAGMLAGPDPQDLELAVGKGLFAVSAEPSGRLWIKADMDMGFPACSARIVDVSMRLPALLRALYSHPGRLVLLRLDPAAGAEENLARLRSMLYGLRGRGLIGSDWPVGEAAPASGWRKWLAWLLAVLGPIFAVRIGVAGFKRARRRVLEVRPEASPVVELASGMLGAAAASVAVGLAVGLLLSGSSSVRLADSLALSTMLWPLAIGALTLFPFSLKVHMRNLRRSPSYAGLVRAAAGLAAAALLLRPRLLLGGTLPWDWVRAASDWSVTFWWWPGRWRELLIGVPALLCALYLVGRRMDVAQPASGRTLLHDPRPWLCLGLLFPIGAIAALGRPGALTVMALGQTAIVLLAGMALGGMVILLRSFIAVWVQSPTPHRTIDPGIGV
ncbi:MAG: hypothetical protein WC881_00925 [Elusimicrobiota bacterium]|jgi:hypothetical protein